MSPDQPAEFTADLFPTGEALPDGRRLLPGPERWTVREGAPVRWGVDGPVVGQLTGGGYDPETGHVVAAGELFCDAAGLVEGISAGVLRPEVALGEVAAEIVDDVLVFGRAQVVGVVLGEDPAYADASIRWVRPLV